MGLERSKQVLNKNIYLVGFMGAGKSTIGQRLASLLKRGFIDTDEMIVARVKLTIDEIFRTYGEAFFRKVECAVVREISQRTHWVVALGGGAPLHRESWETLKQTGITIYLRADQKILEQRLKHDIQTRPILVSWMRKSLSEGIKKVLKQREPIYAQADWIIDCGSLPVEEISMKILKRLYGSTNMG